MKNNTKTGGAGSPPEDHLSPLNPAGVSSTVNGAGTYLIPSSVTLHRVKKGKLFYRFARGVQTWKEF